MVKIELSKDEFEYLFRASFLPNKLHALFLLAHQGKEIYLLNISSEEADELRDLCMEQLQLVGFDHKYALTKEGKILESLVDKFLV